MILSYVKHFGSLTPFCDIELKDYSCLHITFAHEKCLYN